MWTIKSLHEFFFFGIIDILITTNLPHMQDFGRFFSLYHSCNKFYSKSSNKQFREMHEKLKSNIYLL